MLGGQSPGFCVPLGPLTLSASILVSKGQQATHHTSVPRDRALWLSPAFDQESFVLSHKSRLGVPRWAANMDGPENQVTTPNWLGCPDFQSGTLCVTKSPIMRFQPIRIATSKTWIWPWLCHVTSWLLFLHQQSKIQTQDSWLPGPESLLLRSCFPKLFIKSGHPWWHIGGNLSVTLVTDLVK